MSSLTAAQIASDYAEAFADAAEDVLVRRYSGTPAARTKVDTAGRAKVSGEQATELAGGVVQRQRKVILLVDTAITAILPITTSDKIVIRGRECAIKSPDDDTRRVGTSLFAVEITVDA